MTGHTAQMMDKPTFLCVNVKTGINRTPNLGQVYLRSTLAGMLLSSPRALLIVLILLLRLW